MAAKWLYNRFPELILNLVCSVHTFAPSPNPSSTLGPDCFRTAACFKNQLDLFL